MDPETLLTLGALFAGVLLGACMEFPMAEPSSTAAAHESLSQLTAQDAICRTKQGFLERLKTELGAAQTAYDLAVADREKRRQAHFDAVNAAFPVK